MVEMGRHVGPTKGNMGSYGVCASSEAGPAHAIWKKSPAPSVDEIWSASTEGYAHGSDESVEVHVREPDGVIERKRQRFRQVQAVSST